MQPTPESMPRLKWGDKRTHVYVQRWHMCGPCPGILHGHTGMAEVCWIEEGTSVHLINGQRVTLPQGSLVMIRSRDCHGFHNLPGKEDVGFLLVNIAFNIESLIFLRRRYFPKETRFFWSPAKLPYQCALTSNELGWLQQWSLRLAKVPQTSLEVERFLLDLLYELGSESREQQAVQPQWLTQALQQIRDPKHFLQGTHELASLAGQSPEHMTRLLKTHLGMTATDVVNQARLDYAAGQLRTTTKKILTISLDCGFSGLGHFYRAFRKHFGVTPHVFRQQHQTIIRM